jgi:hypothetical protein
MVLGQPVTGKSVRGADPKMVALDGEQATGANPRVQDGGRQSATGGLEEASPKAI